MTPTQPELFTIGHSNHPFERFLDLLHGHAIAAVADVRARPYSRFVPHFGKERLQRLLAAEGIGYLHLGDQLGGTPPRRAGHAAPHRSYAERIEQPGFRDGIARLLDAARTQRTVLLCRERDPLDCHRLHLICRYVRDQAGPIGHILPDGRLEAQEATERRLLEQAGAHELPLFETAERADAAALEQAFDRWWQTIKP